MKRFMPICFIAVLLLASCERSSSTSSQQSSSNDGLKAKVFQTCTIQFRRGDALGGGGSIPVPPTTDSMNGAKVDIVGTLTAVEGDWIIMKPSNTKDNSNWMGSNEIWIPRASILLIQFYP